MALNKSEAKRLFGVLGSRFPGTCPQFLFGTLKREREGKKKKSSSTVNSRGETKRNAGTLLERLLNEGADE